MNGWGVIMRKKTELVLARVVVVLGLIGVAAGLIAVFTKSTLLVPVVAICLPLAAVLVLLVRSTALGLENELDPESNNCKKKEKPEGK
jgi:peptidoglycan/LPS O-acetylase OafA/YrhL